MLINSDTYTYVIIPLLIFLARIIDVSMGTIRVIYIAKGHRFLAPLLGFFEVIIWLMAIRQILVNIDNVISYIAYGGGFAMGTYIGMVIEEKLSIGKVLLRIIPKNDSDLLIEELKKTNHRVTVVDAKGTHGAVKIIFSIIDRHDLKSVLNHVKRLNPKAFYTIEDVRFATNKIPANPPNTKFSSVFSFNRKGK